MFPVATNGGGNCAAFPDVCKTPAPPAPPVPIPYPNMAQCSDGSGSSKVKVENKDVLRKGDQIRMSSGDEAGSVMGVASSKIKGKCEYLMGWPMVKAEGKEVAHLTAMTGQNCGSPQNTAPGAQVAPGQTKVIVMTIKGMAQNVTVKVQKYHPGESKAPANAAMDQNAASTGNAGATAQDKRRASEAIGDEGARNAATQLAQQHGGLGNAPPGLGNPHSFSGPGTFDVVAWCADGTRLIMEAKGGGSPLGTRNVPGTGRCQQGTPQYGQNIADTMANSSNDARRAAGEDLQDAMQQGKAKYYEARTGYDENGCESTVIKEFDP